MSKSKKLSKRIRKARNRKESPGVHYDIHHLLFQRKHWSQGYAHALREHPYMKVLVPMETLHRGLHAKLHDIPVPNGEYCKVAYLELCRRLEAGLLNMDDPPWVRLTFLIELWEETCPATVALLEWQKQILYKFYNQKEPP